jgi:hypothetical protein
VQQQQQQQVLVMLQHMQLLQLQHLSSLQIRWQRPKQRLRLSMVSCTDWRGRDADIESLSRERH